MRPSHRLIIKLFGIYIKGVVLMLLLGWLALPALGLYQCLGIVLAYELVTFRVQFVRYPEGGA